MPNIFLARQPIYNRDLTVFAYELLFRDGDNNQARVTDGDDATSQVLLNAIIDFGLEHIVGDKLAFINITQKYALGELPFPFDQRQIVLEILEDLQPTTELVHGVEILRHKEGYPIALDDFVFSEDKHGLLQCADYVKIDVLNLAPEQIEEQLARIKPYPVKLIAEKVETLADFDRCQAWGFDYYQGYFFCRPRIISGCRTPSSRLAVIQLLSQLQDPEISFKELEDIITRDVSLSYRILRYINSAQFGLRQKITSIQKAISLLGLHCIKTWVTIIALTKFDDKPFELMTTSLVRAKMCELLGQRLQRGSESDFVVGLFSLLDVMMDKPMAEILESLPLTQLVNQALIAQLGDLGQLLKIVLAYEKGEWDTVTRLTALRGDVARDTYLEAIRWTSEINAQLLNSARAA